MTTHYDTLGVAPGADAAAVRAAYLAKARAHHPDRHIDAAPAVRAAEARTMRDVNAAWSVLGDPEARRRYDASLRPPASGRATGAGGGAGGGAPRPRPAATTPRSAPAPRAAAARPVERETVVGHPLRYLPTALIVIVLFGIFVFTAFAAGGRDEAPRPTLAPGDLAAGACVLAGRVLTTVACDADHDAIVVSLVSTARGCPVDTSVYTLDAQRVACLRPTP